MDLFIGDSMLKSGYLYDSENYFVAYPGLFAVRAVAELQNEATFLPSEVNSVTILVGTNDVSQNIDSLEIALAILSLVKWCYTKYGKHVFLVLPLPRVDLRMKELWQLEQDLFRLSERESMPFMFIINLNTDINPYDTPLFYRNSVVKSDMVHLTSEGYSMMYTLIDMIKNAFFEKHEKSMNKKRDIGVSVSFECSSKRPRYHEVNGKGITRPRSCLNTITNSESTNVLKSLIPSRFVKYAE